jgi:hypothetical protein
MDVILHTAPEAGTETAQKRKGVLAQSIRVFQTFFLILYTSTTSIYRYRLITDTKL